MCECGKGSERAFRKWLIQQLPPGSFVARAEAGRGGDAGLPDVLLLDQSSGHLKPVELKVGEVKRGKLKASLRPAQVNWHERLARAGGWSAVLVGVHDCYNKTWIGYWVQGSWAREARDGLPMNMYSVYRLGRFG